jgi:hypothetical protein
MTTFSWTWIIGTWDLESQENFNEYLKETGSDFVERAKFGVLKPTLLIRSDGEHVVVTINQAASNGNTKIDFVFGREHNADYVGRPKPEMQTTYVAEVVASDVVVCTDVANANNSVTFEYVDATGQLFVRMRAGLVVATRIFKRRT